VRATADFLDETRVLVTSNTRNCVPAAYGVVVRNVYDTRRPIAGGQPKPHSLPATTLDILLDEHEAPLCFLL